MHLIFIHRLADCNLVVKQLNAVHPFKNLGSLIVSKFKTIKFAIRCPIIYNSALHVVTVFKRTSHLRVLKNDNLDLLGQLILFQL
jgi:hypothetical protein